MLIREQSSCSVVFIATSFLSSYLHFYAMTSTLLLTIMLQLLLLHFSFVLPGVLDSNGLSLSQGLLSMKCGMKTAESFADPQMPQCSPSYYRCLGGIAVKMNCDDDQVFAPQRGCESRAMTKCQPADRPMFSCVGRPLGNYTNPDAHCSELYYICYGSSTPAPQKCDRNTFFSKRQNRCLVFHHNFECAGEIADQNRVRFEEALSWTTPAPDVPFAEFDCRDREPGFYSNPASPCSSVFYACSAALDAERHACPPDTVYSSGLHQCVNLNQCTVEAATTTTEETPSYLPTIETATTTTEAEEKDPFDCDYQPDGNYAEHKERCARYFYQCAHSKPFIANCPAGLRYDLVRNECDDRQTVPGCSEHDSKRTIDDSFCENRGTGLHVDDKSCHHAVLCTPNKRAVSLGCPLGYVFDRSRLVCDHPATVERPCGYSNEARCNAEFSKGKRFPVPSNCSHYYECPDDFTPAVMRACPPNQSYSPDQFECVEDFRCITHLNSSAACDALLSSIPDDCAGVSVCQDGKAQELSCVDASKRVYDPDSETCVGSRPNCS